MLTRGLAVARVEDGDRLVPDRLAGRGPVVALVGRCLALYRAGRGWTRAALHDAVCDVFAAEPEPAPRRARALARLLDQAGRFETGSDGRAARRRLQLFSMAAHHHPLRRAAAVGVGALEEEVKRSLSRRFGMEWPALAARLHCDAPGEQRLLGFDAALSAEDLVARYDVAQAQAALLDAEQATIVAERDWKAILQRVKLVRLLHQIRRVGRERYRFDLSGPSALLRSTRYYGARLARLLPGLLACRGWRLSAWVRRPNGRSALLSLDAADGLGGGRAPPPEFDSGVEAAFARRFGAERGGWALVREGVVLHDGQRVFCPDFVLRHADGTEVLLEIAGFWTPEYLARKRETLRRFAGHDILVAVPERSMGALAEPGRELVVYKAALRPEAVLAALDARRRPPRRERRTTEPSNHRTSGLPPPAAAAQPPPSEGDPSG